MNSLSWFLYLAGVVSDIKGLLIFIFIFFLIKYLMSVVSVAFHNDSVEYSYKPLKPYPKIYDMGYAVCFMFLTSIIPSQNTLYAIAASQMVEKVIESTVGKKSILALEKWIDTQLGEKK